MNAIEPQLKGNSGHSGYVRADDEWYAEPPWVVRALFEAEQFDGPIWDPCCGLGTIPAVARSMGIDAWGSDAVDRGYRTSSPPRFIKLDFLETMPIMATFGWRSIVTNPPYRGIEDFIRHALVMTDGKVCILARLALMEGQKRAAGLWRDTPIARVHVLARRVGCPPGQLAAQMTDEERDAQAGKVAYAWFVWDRTHTGLPTWDVLP